MAVPSLRSPSERAQRRASTIVRERVPVALKHPACGAWLRQPQDTAAPPSLPRFVLLCLLRPLTGGSTLPFILVSPRPEGL